MGKVYEIQTHLSPVKVYEDIVIVPYKRLFPKPKGGPIYHDWDDKPFTRYYQNKSVPLDEKPEFKEPRIVIDQANFGGVLHPNWGHFVADIVVPRLIPVLQSEFSQNKYLFGAEPWLKGMLPWMKEVLFDYFKIKESNVIILKEPVLVKKLFVDPQIEVVNGGIWDEKYVEPLMNFLLEKEKENELDGIEPQNGCLYVSRAKLSTKATFLGESYLCKILEDAGIKVVYPEELSVKEQLRIYKSYRTLIFAEGSAVHTLQLLSKMLHTKVIVINRRAGYTVAKWQLSYRVREIKYINKVITDFQEIAQFEGMRLLPLFPSLLSFRDLFEELEEATGIKLGCFLNKDKIIASIKDDFNNYKIYWVNRFKNNRSDKAAYYIVNIIPKMQEIIEELLMETIK